MNSRDQQVTIAVAIPAYNEEGLEEFVRELDKELGPVAASLAYFIVDDAGWLEVQEQLAHLGPQLTGSLHIRRNRKNEGHGTTVRRAYDCAAASGADLVLQLDGDGQFEGADTHLLLGIVAAGADIAVGVRSDRTDPWFRKVLSRALRMYLRVLFGVTSNDPNCPFRLYRRPVLEDLLAQIPEEPLVPTVYLTAVAGRSSYRSVEVAVRHRTRRGESPQGTMWGAKQRNLMIPKRLRRFVGQAFVESLRFARAARR